MSQMDLLGLPEPVVHMIQRQSEAEGLHLEWHIGGSDRQVELKLIWRPAEKGLLQNETNASGHKQCCSRD